MKLYIPLQAGVEAEVRLTVRTGRPEVREVTGPELLQALRALAGGVKIGDPLCAVRMESGLEDVFGGDGEDEVPVREYFEGLRAAVEEATGEKAVLIPAGENEAPAAAVHRGCPAD